MKNNTLIKKRKAYFWGQGAEWLSVVFLSLKGYRILARRYKCKSGEVDLIVQKGKLICFIEVKARQNKYDALSALSTKQKQRIIRAAEWYIAKESNKVNGKLPSLSYRFDLMAVEPWHWPTHVKDAWQTDA